MPSHLRYLRYLRIAFSASCGIACVLLVVLWVRSYWWQDYVGYNFEIDYGFGATSSQGRATFRSYDARAFTGISRIRTTGFYLEHFGVSRTQKPGPRWGFGLKAHFSPSTYLTVPHWSLALASGVLSVVGLTPWFRWRFSLRTMLIATTLIAMMLGVAVWATTE